MTGAMHADKRFNSHVGIWSRAAHDLDGVLCSRTTISRWDSGTNDDIGGTRLSAMTGGGTAAVHSRILFTLSLKNCKSTGVSFGVGCCFGAEACRWRRITVCADCVRRLQQLSIRILLTSSAITDAVSWTVDVRASVVHRLQYLRSSLRVWHLTSRHSLSYHGAGGWLRRRRGWSGACLSSRDFVVWS